MSKLTQHGGFDDSLEQSVRDELLAEFSESHGEWKSEDFGEVMDAFDFAACQRPNGSVYPIASGAQCRKGTPISVRPGDKHRDIMKKGQAAGLRVRSILEENDRLRADKGVKVVRGEKAIQSLARRLNQRMGHGQKPDVVKGVKSVDDALKVIQAKGADPSVMRKKAIEEEKRIQRMRAANERADARAKARKEAKAAKPEADKPSQQINKKFLRERTTQKLQAYLDKRKLFPYQRRAIEAELQRRMNAGQAPAVLRSLPKSLNRQEGDIRAQMRELLNAPGKLDASAFGKLGRQLNAVKAQRQAENKTPKPSTAKPYGLDKDYQIIVNKKLLGQKTEILQRILEERSLNPRQRAKIEEELGGRGVSPASAKRPQRRAAVAELKAKGGWDTTEGVKGYKAPDAYKDPDNVLLAKGAMGAAYRTKGPPPGVVKKGQIGEFEIAAWQKLQATGRVPEFHGATVNKNLKEVEYGLGGHVRESKGFLGIGEAKGKPISALGLTDPAERRAVIDEYIRTRKDIHLAGVAHNDMHGGNVFYDRSTGKMQAIDFGLAQISHKAALIEALSTRGGDWQADNFITRWKPSGDEPPAYNQFMRNQRALLRVLDNQGYDSDWITSTGIRTKPEKIDEILDGMSEADARTYLKVLYKGV